MWLRYNTTIALREMYKVDLDADGKLSVPWNYEKNKRNKRFTPTVAVNMMGTNSRINSELRDILYTRSLFVVHTPNIRKPTLPLLSDRALKSITHLLISFNATEATKATFRSSAYQEALNTIISTISPLVPNLKYLGINFWSFQLAPPRAPDAHPCLKPPNAERPDFTDISFITKALLEFIKSHPGVEYFGLLRNMRARGALNWGRGRDAVKKALARDVRKCVEKVYSEE